MKKPTAEGKYLALVTAPLYGFVGRSKNSGNLYIKLPLKIVEPDSDQRGAEIDWFGTLNDKNLERTTKTLATLFGWDGNIKALIDDTADPFTNKEVRVTIELKEYNGTSSLKATWLNSVDEDSQPKGTRINKDEIPDLDELTKAARSFAKEKLDGKKVKQATPVKDDDGDDIPF